MKKVLLTISAGILSTGLAMAQCTPLVAYADSSFGLWPDSATFINDGSFLGQAYDKQIDIKTFVDTSFTGQDVKIDAFKILSVTGLPEGFSWTGGGPTWDGTDTWYNIGADEDGTEDPSALADEAAVAAASDSPTEVTDYPLVVNVDIRIGDADLALLIGQWASALGQAVAVESYILRVNPTVGIADMLNTSRFDVGQNYPNPATGETIINFSTPASSTVDFAVYNMLGVVVMNETINAEAGINEFRFDSNRLSSGMYVYTMRNNGSTVTKRMIVK